MKNSVFLSALADFVKRPVILSAFYDFYDCH